MQQRDFIRIGFHGIWHVKCKDEAETADARRFDEQRLNQKNWKWVKTMIFFGNIVFFALPLADRYLRGWFA